LSSERPHPTPFSYEHSWAMTEAQFVRLNTGAFSHTRRSRTILIGAGLVGGLMLLSPYSAGIGLLVIALCGFLLLAPRMARTQMERRYAETTYLHGPVRYGVSGRGIWLAGEHLSAESSWRGLRSWREQEEWLVLHASGMFPVYLPLGDLRARGLYERVITLARAYGRNPEPVDARAAVIRTGPL
jgi:hypothetical protein